MKNSLPALHEMRLNSPKSRSPNRAFILPFDVPLALMDSIVVSSFLLRRSRNNAPTPILSPSFDHRLIFFSCRSSERRVGDVEVIAAYLHKWRCLDSLSNSLLRRLASAAYLEDLDDGVTRNNLHSIFDYRYLTLFTCRINSLPTRRPRDQLVFHPQRRSRHDHIQRRQQQGRQLPPREFDIPCPGSFD